MIQLTPCQGGPFLLSVAALPQFVPLPRDQVRNPLWFLLPTNMPALVALPSVLVVLIPRGQFTKVWSRENRSLVRETSRVLHHGMHMVDLCQPRETRHELALCSLRTKGLRNSKMDIERRVSPKQERR
jgi:hypothetical protein